MDYILSIWNNILAGTATGGDKLVYAYAYLLLFILFMPVTRLIKNFGTQFILWIVAIASAIIVIVGLLMPSVDGDRENLTNAQLKTLEKEIRDDQKSLTTMMIESNIRTLKDLEEKSERHGKLTFLRTVRGKKVIERYNRGEISAQEIEAEYKMYRDAVAEQRKIEEYGNDDEREVMSLMSTNSTSN